MSAQCYPILYSQDSDCNLSCCKSANTKCSRTVRMMQMDFRSMCSGVGVGVYPGPPLSFFPLIDLSSTPMNFVLVSQIP